MKVWTNTQFKGHNPVGTAAVVVADSQEEAAALLNKELEARGLEPSAEAEEFTRLPTTRAKAVVLHDGNY